MKHFKLISIFFLIFFVLFLFIFAFIGKRGIWEPDEGRYVNIAINMLHSHDFFNLRLNNEVQYFAKPPIAFWMIACCIRLFGSNEWAARLPNALAFCGVGLLIYGIGLKLIPRKPWLPVVIYSTSIFPYAAANIINTDTILTFWETLAMFSFIFALRIDNPVRRRILFDIMWLSLGLAFFTKGPPGLLVLLVIVIYVAVVHGLNGLKQIFVPEGLFGFAIIGFSWYILAIVKDVSLLPYFLRNAFASRVTEGARRLYMPFVVYMPTIVVGGLPWILILLTKLRSVPHLLRRSYWLDKIKYKSEEFLIILWFIVPFIIFCFFQPKPLYILPLFVPIALIIAPQFQTYFDLKRPLIQILLVGWVSVMLIAQLIAGFIPYNRDARSFARYVKKQVHEPIDGVIFVDVTPYYGLNLYLNTGVKRVSVYATLPSKIYTQQMPISEEFNGEKKCLFVVPQRHFYAFNDKLLALGYKPVLNGIYHTRGYTVSYLFMAGRI